MLIRDDVIKDLKTKFNDIGIIGDADLCRLIGFHEDEMDFYYHVIYMNGHNNRSDRNDVYFTMVGSFETLKGVLNNAAYKRLENTFTLNGTPPSEEFKVTIDTI